MKLRLPGDWTALALSVLLLGGTLLLLRNPVTLDDGLRHFAMARVMAEKGITGTDGWAEFLYEGYLADLRVDPWFLSNALLTPLAALDPVPALKLFATASVAAVGAASVLALRALRLPRSLSAPFLALLLFGDQQFLGRLLIGRPFALMTALSILLIWAILRKKDVLALPVMTVAVLLSQLFAFPLAFGFIAVVWLLATGRKRRGVLLACWTMAGAALGMRLHPDGPAYALYLYDAFIRIPFLDAEASLSPEMQSGLADVALPSVLILLGASLLLAVSDALAGGMRTFLRSDAFYLLLVAVFLLPGFVLWVRTIDLLWPVLVLLLASLTGRNVLRIRRTFGFLWKPRLTRRLLGALATCQILLVPAWLLLHDEEKNLSAYDAVNAIPAGARVLNTEWERFFVYVLLRPDLKYATGIDPSFTYLADPEVTDLLRRIETNPDEQTFRALLRAYPADYLLVPNRPHGKAAAVLSGMKEVRNVALSPEAAVYRVDGE